jgi:hypothetical protein
MVLPKPYDEKLGALGFGNTPLGSEPWKVVKRELGRSYRIRSESEVRAAQQWQPHGAGV